MSIKLEKISGLSESQRLQYIRTLCTAQLDSESDPLANLANITSIIYHVLEDLNWAGFYLVRGGELVLGPFQGLPACTRIAFGKGVCGTAWKHKSSVLVADVEAFPGHIACDSASRSELVIPILRDNEVVAVLDLDSPVLDRFEEKHQQAFEQLVNFIHIPETV